MGGVESKPALEDAISHLFASTSDSFTASQSWEKAFVELEHVPFEKILEYFPSGDLVDLVAKKIDNVMCLIRKIVLIVREFLSDTSDTTTKDRSKRLLVAIRILTRLIPFLFQDDAACIAVTNLLLPNLDSNDIQENFILSVVDLLFIPGFSLPLVSSKSRIFYVIWESGIGSETSMQCFHETRLNRQEILRLLLVLISRSIYFSPRSGIMCPYLYSLTCLTKEAVVLALLCSCLNTIVKHPLSSTIPYQHVLFPSFEDQEVTLCAQLLCCALDFDPTFFFGRATGSVVNLFRHFIRSLYKFDDFDLIFSGLNRLILSPIIANAAYLPGSRAAVKCYSELIILLWRLLELNQAFFRHAVYSAQFPELLSALLVYAVNPNFDQSAEGLLHLSCFLLLHFSSDREFAVKLNEPFPPSYFSAGLPPFFGTYADFLVITFCRILSTNTECRIKSIGECLFMTVLNVSPFLKHLSLVSCEELFQLFKYLSHGSRVFTDAAFKMILQMLEIFCYLIQYQAEGNSCVIYSLLNYKSIFMELSKMQFQTQCGSLAQYQAQSALLKESLRPILALLEFLTTEVIRRGLASNLPDDSELFLNRKELIKFISSLSLVGVLPLPRRPISIRRFKMNRDISYWLTSFLYGLIFVHSNDPTLWESRGIRLFRVKPLQEL